MKNRNPFFNASGYPDPTAFYGTKKLVKQEKELQDRLNNLVNVVHMTAQLAGFEVVGRITFKDKKTGKEFK